MVAQSNPTDVYLRTVQSIHLDDGRSVPALTFVANPADGPAADLTLQQRAAVILKARGARGSNREYLEQTAERLASLLIHDAPMQELCELVRAPGRSPLETQEA